MSSTKTNNDDYFLSTFDNPFNPFEDFYTWFKYDLILGHNCCQLVDYYAATSPVFSDEVNEHYIDQAVDDIIASDPTLFRKVTPETYRLSKV